MEEEEEEMHPSVRKHHPTVPGVSTSPVATTALVSIDSPYPSFWLDTPQTTLDAIYACSAEAKSWGSGSETHLGGWLMHTKVSLGAGRLMVESGGLGKRRSIVIV